MSEIINIEFQLRTFTKLAKIQLTSKIIELLLFCRKQIPFNFDLFEKIIDKQILDNTEQKSWNSFKITQQKLLAKSTLESIVSLKSNLRDVLDKNPGIDEILVLFGSTLTTPLESYLIKLPTLQNSDEKEDITDNLRQILLQLVQRDELNNKKNLRTTNMFVLVKDSRMELETFGDVINLSNLGNFKIPNKCPKICINMINVHNDDFSIFNDFSNLSINEQSLNLIPTDIKKTEENCTWFQSRIVVKGFNDVLVNNKPIWN